MMGMMVVVGRGVGGKPVLLHAISKEKAAGTVVGAAASQKGAPVGRGYHRRLLSGHGCQLGMQEHGMERWRRWEGSRLLLLLLLTEDVSQVLLVQVGVEDVCVRIGGWFLDRRRTDREAWTSGG